VVEAATTTGRTWRDGGAIIDPLDAESEGKGRTELSGPCSPNNISEKYGPPTSSYLFIFSEKTWSTLSFITITFYFIVLSTNPFENNIDCHMEKTI
jgi:hypothetical protein